MRHNHSLALEAIHFERGNKPSTKVIGRESWCPLRGIVCGSEEPEKVALGPADLGRRSERGRLSQAHCGHGRRGICEPWDV